MIKANLLNFTNGIKRIFKIEAFKNFVKEIEHYQPAGLDSNPPTNAKAIFIDNNSDTNCGIAILFQDKIIKLSKSGETRIYSTDETGSEIKAKIYFTNDGKINILATNDINLETTANKIESVTGSLTIEANTISISSGSGDFTLNSGTDNGIKYAALETSLNNLVSQINTELNKRVLITGQTGSTVTLDMTSSKVDKMRL